MGHRIGTDHAALRHARQVPPRVEYSLTEVGRTLAPVLDAMKDWGDGYVAHSETR
ncbi:winged helix-turn-helix transcriptional regulator [Burkholderia metallica]|uniref:winged helix-turn-helix transcriptional regulator n=1 Tax=Burkholderia metallica TaxID=488729 RepID=UPI003AAECCFD